MSFSRQHYWLLGIGCGLLAGAHLPLYLLIDALLPGKLSVLPMFVFPTLVFGAAFGACVRAVSRIGPWRMCVFAVGAGVANYLAWELSIEFVHACKEFEFCRNLPLLRLLPPVIWGLVFGVLVVVCAAGVFERARRVRSVLPAVPISAVVTLA